MAQQDFEKTIISLSFCHFPCNCTINIIYYEGSKITILSSNTKCLYLQYLFYLHTYFLFEIYKVFLASHAIFSSDNEIAPNI